MYRLILTDLSHRLSYNVLGHLLVDTSKKWVINFELLLNLNKFCGFEQSSLKERSEIKDQKIAFEDA